MCTDFQRLQCAEMSKGDLQMKRHAWQWISVVSLLMTVAVIQFLVTGQGKSSPVLSRNVAQQPHSQLVSRQLGADHASGEMSRVLIIGSSVAQGWKDHPQDGGYLRRAFRALPDVSNNRFVVYDKGLPGLGVTHIVKQYPHWLKTIRPNIVVIAWGGLDDLHAKTPMPVFQSQIKWQIAKALQAHAVVIVVTSPVSRASYTNYKTAQPQLFDAETTIAKNFHNPNVHEFYIFNQMKRYLTTHHQTYVPYMGDGWHPNAAGHELAAELFIDDWSQQFGVQSVKFHDHKKHAFQTSAPEKVDFSNSAAAKGV
jgi:acyl-CoA thioesterase-1